MYILDMQINSHLLLINFRKFIIDENWILYDNSKWKKVI